MPTTGRASRVARRLQEIPADLPVLVLASRQSDLPKGGHYFAPEVEFRILDHPEGPLFPTPHRDLAAKRNLGMEEARRAGRSTVIFLDDDISITRDAIQTLLAGTRRYEIAAMAPIGHPDHSILYGVLNRVGLVEPFVSGSCLAVRTSYLASHPTIYNEDWFFMWPAMARRAVAFAGQIRQEAPTNGGQHTPERSCDEELGDVLGEGFLTLLHLDSRGPHDEALLNIDYWQVQLRRRAATYRIAMSTARCSDWADRDNIMELLSAGYATHRAMCPDILVAAVKGLLQVTKGAWPVQPAPGGTDQKGQAPNA